LKYRETVDGIGSVSEVGLGCWQIGGADWGEVSETDAIGIMHAAADSGVTFFDTADVYGLGRSEELVGKFLTETAANITVATKLGRFPTPGWPSNFEESSIRAHTEASLTRLGVDRLALTQLHCVPTEVLRRGDVFDYLRTLEHEGKIERFGASVESMEEALICLEQPGLASLQIIFNIFRQKPIETVFKLAKEKGVSLIVRLPLASGLLTGKFTANTTFPEQDHRNYNRDGAAFNVGETFAGLPFVTGLELVEKIRPHVPDGISMAEMALRWCIDYDAVTVVIPGAKSQQMAASNAAASDLPRLSEDLHTALAALYESQVKQHIRGPN